MPRRDLTFAAWSPRTVLKLLLRMYDPDEGTITVDGQVARRCNGHVTAM